MERLLTLLAPRIAQGGPVWDRIAAWTGDISGGTGASVALRLAGGLHRLVLEGEPDLVRVYPPNDVSDTALKAAAEDAVARHAAFLDAWMDRPPQTNEVRRSAPLIAAAHCLSARWPLPLVLSELGASAGLNLAFDRYALALRNVSLGPPNPALTLRPVWRGPPPPDTTISVAERQGVDLSPLDPIRKEDRLRLLSYIWPDQPERLENTRRAIRAARLAGVKVEAGDAAAWLDRRLSDRHPGHLHLIFHTIAWQYFPADTAARCRARIEAAGAEATDDAPIAWLAMEADGDPNGAGLTLWLWPGDRCFSLGRIDFHGRWINWIAADI